MDPVRRGPESLRLAKADLGRQLASIREARRQQLTMALAEVERASLTSSRPPRYPPCPP
jgi:hypothetical protein